MPRLKHLLTLVCHELLKRDVASLSALIKPGGTKSGL